MMAVDLTDEKLADIRDNLDQSAAIVKVWGWYETGPREQNLNLAREALELAGFPPEKWGPSEVEWAKNLTEEALRKNGLEPRGTELIRGLEADLDFTVPVANRDKDGGEGGDVEGGTTA